MIDENFAGQCQFRMRLDEFKVQLDRESRHWETEQQKFYFILEPGYDPKEIEKKARMQGFEYILLECVCGFYQTWYVMRAVFNVTNNRTPISTMKSPGGFTTLHPGGAPDILVEVETVWESRRPKHNCIDNLKAEEVDWRPKETIPEDYHAK